MLKDVRDMPSILHLDKHNDYPCLAKFLLQCRGERTKVIRYHDLDIRT